ncbi:hypothetical protein [Streptomyces sp. PD-S100-1]
MSAAPSPAGHDAVRLPGLTTYDARTNARTNERARRLRAERAVAVREAA